MKVKEISRTGNVAWSPSSVQSISLACGTVAQQLDATFSTSAKLEVFSLDLASPGLAMPLLGSVDSPHRFHKIVWSGHVTEGDETSGRIIGGSDNGIITVWSAAKVASSSDDALLHQTSQHVGAVRTLDVNPFQSNLLVSGAGESEIFIWDLNNLSTPMSPGTKVHPLEDISGVAWNRQVQHIMASTSPGGKSVVWDLRKNEPIIQVNDSSSKVRCSAIAWHPDVATQMVTASSDDRAPIIQMWDLRYATAPMRILDHHTRGVLSVAWCQQDSDLLLSAAKDNQVLCWNPNTDLPGGEVIYEMPGTSQWIFECQWCPRNPAIISTASFDGHVTMYSLLGGGGGAKESVEPPTASVTDSEDIFAGLALSAKAQTAARETAPLKTPPKWLRRPCGASFAFGGKLVSFGNTRGPSTPKIVSLSQVITQHDLVQRSHDLEESLSRQQFGEFCEGKSHSTSNENEKNMWNFLKVTFDSEPRRQYLRLLGYDADDLAKKFSTWTKMSGVSTLQSAGGLDVNELSKKLATIPVLREDGGELLKVETEGSEASSTAAIFGSEAGDGPGVFDVLSTEPSAHASKRVSTTSNQQGALTPPPSMVTPSFPIPTNTDADGMLAKALLVGNFEAAVDICISADRMAEALILAVAGGADLLRRTQLVYFQKNQSKVSKLISSVVQRNWTDLARTASLENWREILAALVTFAGPEEFSSLCDLLGNRLEKEMDGCYRDNAALCYICSGNIDKFVECWSSPDAVDGLALQDLVEKVVILRKAVEKERRQHSTVTSQALTSKMKEYSGLLASQGSLATALKYLQENGGTQNSSAVLYDQLYNAQRSKSSPSPNFPFSTVDVLPPQPVSQVTPSEPQPGRNTVTTGLTRQMNPYVRGDQTDQMSFPGQVVTTTTTTQVPPHSQPVTQPLFTQHPGLFTPAPGGVVSNQAPPPTNPVNDFNTDTATSWNDPPTLKTRKPPPVQVPTSSTGGMAPIVNPVMAPISTPVQPVPQAPPTPQDQHPPSPLQPSPNPVVPAVQKAPIPQEHVPMVQAFEGMLERCKTAATSTAVRRKLDDISKKLAILCDLLRIGKLSPDVLQGLHYIAQDTQSLNYAYGLERYNHMVSAGNFSEISSFMPGLKALLQLGTQLRV